MVVSFVRYLAVAGLMFVAPLPIPRAAAEIQKIMRVCDGQLCPFFRAPIKVPEGWRSDEAAGLRNGVTMLLPAGKDFYDAGTIIYVAVRHSADKEPLETFVAREQESWRSRVPDVTITRLTDVPRNSGDAFVQYRYEAPSLKSQGFERVAATIDRDKDGNSFLVAVVATALSRTALDEAEEAYLSILRQY